MKNKTDRLIAIKQIINKEPIGSQEELLQKLIKMGYNYTQATLSRDLKQLNVSRVPHHEKGYIYKITKQHSEDNTEYPKGQLNTDLFKKITFSGNLAVIKTYSGFANSIAVSIDLSNIYEIIGTIAGDDSVIVILREGVTHQQAKQAFISSFPGIKEIFEN